MCEHVRNDWYFADYYFFPESNDWQNFREGTYEPLYAYQGAIMAACEENQVVWIQASRGSAKSYTIARWIVSWCLRHPFQAVIICAPSFRQSKQLYDYCCRIIKANSQVEALVYKLEADIPEDNIKRGHEVIMTFMNGSSIEALPTGNGQMLRGRRATVLVCDEFYLFPRDIYVSHILPFLNVKRGDKPAKLIHLTTSWYTDCFAYSVLMDIARYVKQNRKGYAILDITIDDVINSSREIDPDEPDETPRSFPAELAMILHQLETNVDSVTGRLSDEARMTFYNHWIKSSASWYRPDKIEEAKSGEVAVLEEQPPKWTAPFVLGVDPAGQGADSTQMCVLSCSGDDRRDVHAVYKWQKLTPEQIAGHIHSIVDKFPGIKKIVVDKSGTLGADVATKCIATKQLIDGIWQDRKPITPWDHPDADKARAHIVLTRPADEQMVLGFYGPRVDSTIGGELELKNALHNDMKARIDSGQIRFANEIDDADYFNEKTARGELLDNIREACGQLPKIDRKRDPETRMPLTDGKGNYYFTRPPKDDGAYSMVYGNWAANIVCKELVSAPRNPEQSVRWSFQDSKPPPDTHTIVRPRL